VLLRPLLRVQAVVHADCGTHATCGVAQPAASNHAYARPGTEARSSNLMRHHWTVLSESCLLGLGFHTASCKWWMATRGMYLSGKFPRMPPLDFKHTS
jgi:hypothetical protein